VTERFKRSRWRGRITSSDGYSVRVIGRTGVEYCDSAGCIMIGSEVMSGPGLGIVVYSGSIPDRPERPRSQVLERLDRSFASQRWRVTVEDAWPDSPDG
jgi:hypothetical protein